MSSRLRLFAIGILAATSAGCESRVDDVMGCWLLAGTSTPNASLKPGRTRLCIQPDQVVVYLSADGWERWYTDCRHLGGGTFSCDAKNEPGYRMRFQRQDLALFAFDERTAAHASGKREKQSVGRFARLQDPDFERLVAALPSNRQVCRQTEACIQALNEQRPNTMDMSFLEKQGLSVATLDSNARCSSLLRLAKHHEAQNELSLPACSVK